MSTQQLRLLASFLGLLFVAALPASAKRLDGVFTEVKDANVVVLDYGEGTYDVRLYGTEAPAEGQPFAAEALAFVRDALLGKRGAMRFKYRNARGEMVARIFYFDAQGSERDLGIDLAAQGLVWLRPGARYRPEVDGAPDALTAAQSEAQEARRGVWSFDRPVAPWVYRGEEIEPEAMTSGLPGEVAGNLDINISRRSGGDNECAIAKNPSNPLQMIAHCNSLATPWLSPTGGLTWTLGGSIGSYCCDPNLAWDSFGNIFATFINAATNAIVTMISTNGGATFSSLASFSGSVDQPSVVAHDGKVWIVWNSSGNMVASGATVTGLGAVGSFSAAQTVPTTTSCSFGDVAVSPIAPNAVVQVCVPSGGQTGGNIRVNIDADGLGAGGFGSSIVATTTLVGGFDFIPAQSHRSIDAEAGLAFDRNPASPHYGRLYLVYTDEATQESNNTNIMLRYSDNTGATWSSAIQVNTDATTRSQFLPKIASDPATGNVAICWHDARNSAANTAVEEWCDSFTPASFPTFNGNVQVGDGASLSTDASMDFGDYSGLACSGGVAHPIWADSSNSTGDNPNGAAAFDAYTDRLSVSLAYSLTTAVSGSGNVTSLPAGINCPGVCTADFSSGSSVSLTPTPTLGWLFSGWSGACSGSGACNVSMTQAQSVTATFLQGFALDLSVSGSGTVTSSPAGINCPGDCTENYATGTSVSLTPAPSVGWQFTGWTGACSGSGACNVSMTQARAVSATFTQLFALDVTVSGSGTVTSSPAGINCPGDCTENYATGTSVSLTPAPSVGWQFTGWSGACTGSGACNVSMTQARAVTATFTQFFALDVTVSGSGTVTSSPAGINCPGDCTENYATGTSVSLTPAPSVGWQFTGWTGACSGSGACNVSMTQARAVVATFAHVFVLDATVIGTGTVTSAPLGIDCPGDCTESFLDGTAVTLTPVATGDWRFRGWSGACTGSGVCNLTMSETRSVSATFDTMPFLDDFESDSTAAWSQTVP